MCATFSFVNIIVRLLQPPKLFFHEELAFQEFYAVGYEVVGACAGLGEGEIFLVPFEGGLVVLFPLIAVAYC